MSPFKMTECLAGDRTREAGSDTCIVLQKSRCFKRISASRRLRPAIRCPPVTDPSKPHHQKTSGIHFPPPFLYAGLLLLGLLLEDLLPLPRLPRTPSRLMAAALLLSGGGLLLWSLGLFLRARTSPLPMRPTTALVGSGPYRWTRNPMYLGMLLVYLGAALLFDVTWALVLSPVIVALVNRLVIAREERYLEAKFGEEYLQYKARVGRWI